MPQMTPSERIATALSHREADRVPLVLSLTVHGARELGQSIREYYSRAENVVEAQLRMQRRYGHDALLGFRYGPAEYEAWGGEAVFVEDGPPNSGAPAFSDPGLIDTLAPPRLEDCPSLLMGLEIIRGLKDKSRGEIPVMGVVLSPFSVAVMQLGFDHYLDLLYGDRDRFWRLMALNQAFATTWGNAQLEAGAASLVYFDPLASPSMIPLELYQETGFRVACETIRGLKGPTVTHLASGRATGAIGLIAQTGTTGVGISCQDDLREVKRQCAGRLGIVGNLNAIAMVKWTRQETETRVREALAQGAPGGGFILSDHQGELPWGVSEETIGTIAESVRTWGCYPMRAPDHG